MRRAADLLLDALGRALSAAGEALDPDLPELLAESEGRRLALVVRGSDRVLTLEVQGGRVRVLPPRRLGDEAAGEEAAAGEDAGSEAAAGEAVAGEGAGGEAAADAPDGAAADLVLTGTVPGFLAFLRAVRSDPPPDDPFAPLEARGAPEARAAFVELLRRVDPDLEALAARAVGGVAAHAAARTTLGRLDQARRAATRLVDDVSEYLAEEAGILPAPADRTRFAADVRALLDKVAELERRLDRAAPRG